MASENPVFEYRIGFEKTGTRYRILDYNSPYKNSEQELEDVALMFDGVDLNGVSMPRYKVVEWKDLKDGRYTAHVTAYYSPNPDGKTFDQVFLLKEIKVRE